ncbi:MAG: hypothetical protein WC391_09840 [Methanoregula sp.]
MDRVNTRYTMSSKIPWDKSRKEWKPVNMTVTFNGRREIHRPHKIFKQLS